jgi:geranylgeranyl diphosphate synthase type I
MSPEEAYLRFASETRERTGRAVLGFLGERREQAVRASADAAQMIDAVTSLATRGGKRIRAVLLALAYEGFGGAGGGERVVSAAVAIELLQVYMLIHDDWMDGDDVRRGGPSVHRMLGDAFGSQPLGDATAILAGDYASALAQEALGETPVPGAELARATLRFARIQRDVVLGQVVDVCAERRSLGTLTLADVERMHAMKTGAYTVAGPLALGALLAGASNEAVAGLEAFAGPLGVAFQLRDDVLGTFGDPSRTGKDRFGDFKQKKRTGLVAAALEDPALAPLVVSVIGPGETDLAACETLADAMVSRGAKERVEVRVRELLAESRARLGALGLRAEHRDVLEGALAALGERSS